MPFISTFGGGSAGARGFGRGFGRAFSTSFPGQEWTATLTPGNTSGQFGPDLSQARSGLSITTDVSDFNENTYSNDTALFDCTAGRQKITLPASGLYEITAYGAKGAGNDGGPGAVVSGQFILENDLDLTIYVGQQGEGGSVTGGRHGAGGASFVVRTTDYSNATLEDILVIAAGGGGAEYNDGNGPGTPIVRTSGQSSDSGSGGTDGQGGSAGGNNTYDSGGGGGFLTDGGTSTTQGGVGGSAFINGGSGGAGTTQYDPSANGGFGGGGGADTSGAGGGGFSGGAGGNNNTRRFGGNGGSFIAASAQSAGSHSGSYNHQTNQVAGYQGSVGVISGPNFTEGKVIITLVG